MPCTACPRLLSLMPRNNIMMTDCTPTRLLRLLAWPLQPSLEANREALKQGLQPGLLAISECAFLTHFFLAGHYVALVKNGDKWLLFEDESVELVNEGVVQSVFGSSQVRSAES